ncbi:DNA-binding transcriptional regulator YiaG [Clostridiales Family XIII bacterium PM5-7]
MSRNNEIVKLVKEKREDLELTRADLARMLGCTTRIVRYWENGERGMSIDMADKALRLLGISYTLGKRKERAND